MNLDRKGTPIIIDAGTGNCKAGFAGDKLPRVVFPTNLERDQRKDSIARNQNGRSRRRSFTNPRTITKGAIKDILKRVYYDELHVDPTHHPILFVDSPVSSEDFRKNILQILFQDFNVPACYLCSQPILSLHAQGKNTGVVVDSGHGSTYVAPVHEGKVLQSAVTQIPVAGRELDNFLALLCRKRGYAFHSSQEQHALRDIKEKQCYVSRDPNHELETSENRFFVERRVELPEGEIISLQTERFRCPEALFKPSDSADELTKYGLHTALSDSLAKVSPDIRQSLHANIILSGGSTMFHGLGQRLSNALAEILPPGTQFHIDEPPDRNYSAWIGGSMLAISNDFGDFLLSKEKYDEYGPAEVLCRGLGISN